MEYSTQRATSDGTLALLTLSIEYFDRSEISVFFDGVVDALPWSWVGTTENKIAFDPVVPLGVEVLVRRSTDLAKPRHEFSLGAKFIEANMDENFVQILHIAQEAKEGSGLSEIFNDLNFHGFKAVNVANGTAPLDAVNVQQLTVHAATIVGYRDQTLGYRNEAEDFRDEAEAFAVNAGAAAAAAVAAHEAAADPHPQYASVAEANTWAESQTIASGKYLAFNNAGGPHPLAAYLQATPRTDPLGPNLLLLPDKSGTLATTDDVAALDSITLGTAVTASGTTVDFAIPAGAKRVTATFHNISTTGTSGFVLRLGHSGGVVASGYDGLASVLTNAAAVVVAPQDTGLFIATSAATNTTRGVATFELQSASTHVWCGTGAAARTGTAAFLNAACSVDLPGELTTLRFATSNGTDTFDAGSINVSWEF